MDIAKQLIEINPCEIEFINAYLEAIDFTDTGDIDQPESGRNLDEEYVKESIIDCLAFYGRIWYHLSDEVTIAQAGHDFWLTRNSHGTGFWDRPEVYGEWESTYFTELAEFFGETYPLFAIKAS